MKFQTLTATGIMALSVAVAGCSGNSTSSSQNVQPNQYVNGFVGASNVHNAVVQAVPIDTQGQTETEIDDDYVEVYAGEKATTTAAAYYSVEVDSDDTGSPMTLIVLPKEGSVTTVSCQLPSGCSAEWNYGEDAPVDGDLELRASVGNVQDNMRININWITHLASALAYTSYIDTDGSENENPTTPRTGVYTAFTTERANLWLNRLFGVADIISSRALEPADLYNDSGLSSALLPDAIYYGALAAAAQQLAKEDGISETEWLAGLVHEFLINQGQLYQKGGGGISLYDIFRAAHQVLADNQAFFSSRSFQVPASISSVLTRLDEQMAALNEGEMTAVTVAVSEVDDWLDRINNAKVFIADLNERLINYKGQDPNTCPSGTAQTDTSCVHSFIDPAYVAKTVAYYDGLNAVYEGIAPSLNAASQQLRDVLFDYIACLNNGCPSDTRYDAEQQIFTVPGDDPLDISFTGVSVDDLDAAEGEYYAFDFVLSGSLMVNCAGCDNAASFTVTFAPVVTTDDSGVQTTNDPYFRIVYDTPYTLPPLTQVADENDQLTDGYHEPLGFSLSWPYVEIPVTVAGNQQTLELYVELSLLGVKDVLAVANDEVQGQVYHYNITELAVSLLSSGKIEGLLQEDGEQEQLADLAELTLTATTSQSANYYSDSVWPEADDFLKVRDGFTNGLIESGLFTYEIAYDQTILYGTDNSGDAVYRSGDYVDVQVNGYGINRIEIFAADDVDSAGVRKCSVVVDNGVRTTDTCNSLEETDAKLTVQEVVDGGYLGYFSIPARGVYKVLFHEDGDGNAILQSTETLDGELIATFAQGFEALNVRLAHELVECADGADCLTAVSDSFSRLPVAIVDMSLTRKAPDEWEVGISAGYDYDYLVDVLPTGSRAQSLYLAYAVGESQLQNEDGSSSAYAYELSDLIIFRGGVTLFTGDDSGESIGFYSSSDVQYGLDGTEQPCGIINRDESDAADCDAVGYVTYRNSLVGVVREERDGIYVVRFSDGQFIILGG